MDPRAWRRFRAHGGARIGLVLVGFVLSMAVFGPLAAPHDPDQIFDHGLTEQGLPVGLSAHFPLGSDSVGRDELSRLLHGARTSLLTAITATLLAALIGLSVGTVTGYFGGVIDSAAMQFVDLLQSLPFLLIAIVVNRTVSSASLLVLIVLLGVLSWTSLARVTRAKTMQVRELDFVHAARALGMNEWRILLRHVLPNVTGPALIIGTTLVANIILTESAMSFLGIGVPPPASTWGTMLYEAQQTLTQTPRLAVLPGLMIVITVFGFNLVGEGLRDALDPKD